MYLYRGVPHICLTLAMEIHPLRIDLPLQKSLWFPFAVCVCKFLDTGDIHIGHRWYSSKDKPDKPLNLRLGICRQKTSSILEWKNCLDRSEKCDLEGRQTQIQLLHDLAFPS